MIFPPDIACFITFKDFIIPIGWVASAFLAVCVACHLDRRKSINGIISQIEIIKDTIHTTEDGRAAYKESIDDLQKCIFGVIPMLNGERRGELIDAWRDYRAIDFSRLPDETIGQTIIDGASGQITIYKHTAVINGLDRITKTIR